LAADGWHLVADVATSGGVILGVALVSLTGWLRLDPALAACVALNILWSGWALVRGSIGGLMDEAASPEMLDRIKSLISQHGEGAIEAHDVRTRHAGRVTFIDFHLVVPGDMRVAEAHDICDRIEAALRRDVEGVVVVIHVEPEHKAKHSGILVV
jgi:cation diffusion facilitator family transporter